ncbi:MAG TPA: CDC27 family protein [Thermoanaerobaculia bacterium]|nr:CDC27 family protein [Thermoanaerobaculia bacterium]
MPFTFNGIGTHYYGRRNASAVNGVCAQCHRNATLSSYDTTEFFVIIYIPLIPVAKYRIMDQCSSCRRHYRMPLAQFQANVGATIEPLREAARRDPLNAEKREALIRELIGAKLTGEAETEARDAATAFPQSDVLNYLAGVLAEARGDVSGAESWFRRTVAANAHHNAARIALGRTLVAQDRQEEAVRELQEGVAGDPQSVGGLYLLAESQMHIGRWSEAYTTLQRLLNLNASYATDRDLLRKLADCKRKLGYELSPAEKKASRSWWPFGRSRARKSRGIARPGGNAVSAKGVFIALAAILACIVIGGGAVGWWRQSHVRVFFDNALGHSVTLNVDGESMALGGRPPLERSLKPGTHRIVVLDGGNEREHLDATIETQPFFEALFEPDFYVYNVAGAAIYSRAEMTYAAEDFQRKTNVSYVAFDRWIRQSDADYVFEEPPSSVQADSGSSTSEKTSFQVAPSGMGYRNLAYVNYSEGKPKEAEKALAKGIELAPCDDGIRGDLISMLDATGQSDRSRAAAKAWVSACDDSINAHRTYQNAFEENGQRDMLLVQYRERLAKDPSATNHYFYGRLLEDSDAAIAEYQEAARLDPKLSWPHLALAYQWLALENDQAAFDTLDAVLSDPTLDSNALNYYALAAIGSHHEQQALARIEKEKQLDRYAVWQARMTLARAAGDWQKAKDLMNEREKDEGLTPATSIARAEIDRDSGAPFEQVLARLDRSQETVPAKDHFVFMNALERGDATEALALEAKSRHGGASADTLYAIEAAFLAGDPNAPAHLREFRDAIANGEGSERRLLRALADSIAGKLTPDALLQRIRPLGPETLPHGFFALGVRARIDRDPASASKYFRKAAERAADRTFPYRLATKLASAAETPAAQ